MKHIFLLLFLLIFTLGYSQSGTIRGEIKSERSNEPAPFASVVVQSTGAGVSTDIDGKFEINNLKPGLYNLIVASVGFKQKTIFEIEV
ncbi:MAG: hypothetical protein ACI87V_001646, partial [Flavobacteriales bacterium]